MSAADMLTTTLSSVVNKLVFIVNGAANDTSEQRSYENVFDKSLLVPGDGLLTTQESPLSDILPDNKPPDDTHSEGEGIAVMTMLIGFSLFGCLGNVLVLYVFSKKSDKVSSTIFILALAWTDFFVCLFLMPYTVALVYVRDRLSYDFFCKAFHFINTSNVPLSAFLMVAIAVDRYFSICHPFLHVVTPRRAKVAISCLVLLAFSLGSITSCLFSVYRANCTDTAQLDTSGSDYVTEITSTIVPLYERDGNRSSEVACSSLVYTGKCEENPNIFSYTFLDAFQKIYISFYIISLLSVFTLYFFIYRSVVKRRAWRRKQKSWSHSPMTATGTKPDQAPPKTQYCAQDADGNNGDGQVIELTTKSNQPHNLSNGENGDATKTAPSEAALPLSKRPTDMLVVANTDGEDNGVETSALSSAEKKTIRERRDFNFLANIRTAIMLFVVAVVFIISFLPAWLMATRLISYHIIIFYTHFIYNVVNPVIYAFMNQSFRKELKRVFQRDCRHSHRYKNRTSMEQGFSRTAVSVCETPDETSSGPSKKMADHI
ncbi:uncharacterized protein LOC131957075 [Physella acuta]|uniref:uncharacterized protein LOC131957075 n=1 Tax=Physella acuta TaxID=109671 RepID=UPI0027DD6A2D|nr:uncharacterized protein LOC131957075 [Physella acuta]